MRSRGLVVLACSEEAPQIGEVYLYGDDSWGVKNIEKMIHPMGSIQKCNHDDCQDVCKKLYLVVMMAYDKDNIPPVTGCVLEKFSF